MNRYIITGGLRALLFCILFINMFSFDADGKSSKPSGHKASEKIIANFDNPDFAFPQNVRKDADKVFGSAMASGHPETALKAVMQMAAANVLTSTDSLGGILKRYDEIGERFGEPWKNLSALLSAKALTDVYTDNRWNFDQRLLPEEELNKDPMLWSGLQFRSRISALCETAVSDPQSLGHTNLLKISGLLNNLDADNPCSYSVLDFMVYQIINLYERAGLQASDRSQSETIMPLSLINLLIDMDESNQTKEDIRNGGTKALLRARLKKAELLGEPDPSSEDTLISGYAADLLELYPVGSPLNGSLISSLYKMGRFNTNSLASRKELYRLVRDASEYEKGKIKQYLDYIADRLLIPEYTLTTQAQWLPQGNTISIDSKNITDGYLLMVPISYSQAESGKLRNRDLKATGTIRVVCHIAAKAGEPTEETQQISVNDLTPGYYALVMSGNKDLSGIFQRTLLNKPDLVLVSSLSCFTSDDSRLMKLSETPDGKERMSDKYLYIVNGRDNSPIKGATVEFSNSDYDKRFEKKILTTDSQGKVLLPYARCQAVITHGNDRLKWSGNKNYAPVEQTSRLRANIFTDLAIYHPGDSIRIATVIIQSDGRDVETVSDKEVEIKLVNANHEEVGQVTVRTDSYGRAITALQIPATGLTGRFVIYVKDGKRIIGTSSVEVAEYKAPSFRVILDRPEVEKTDPADTSSAGTGIILTGSVMTYSGVPLSSAEVELNVRFDPWWSRWLRSAPPADDFGATVSTDSNGRFRGVITLPADGASSYNYGRFYATATATSSAGETRMSDRQGFAVGEGYSLSFRGNSEIEVDDDLKLQISVVDILDQPVVKDLHYSLTQLDYAGEKEEKIISEGTFKSPVLKLDPSIIPSGAYRLKVVLPEAVRVTENNLTTWKPDSLDVKVIFWRKNDTRPPVATPLWTPQPIYYATPGESHVMVTVGAGYEDEWIYMQISNQEGTLRREWLRPSGKNMRIKVDAPAAGECITLYFAGCHDLSRSKSFVKIYPAEADKKTLFRVDTFRDRIVPGNQETWRFRLMSGWASPDGLKGDDGMSPLGNAAVMAVMSNEALDALVPFRWNFNPRMYVNYSALGGIEFPWSRQLNVTRDLRGISYMENPVQFPLLTFLYSDVSGKKIFYSVSSKAVVTGAVESDKADGVVMDYELPVANMSMKRSSSEMASEANMELEEETVEDAVSGDGLSDDGEGELCGMEMPLAFFNPSLTTDSEGYVEVEFTVPDFNTTWAFQILGYDRSGNAAVDRMTARASKPVMVSTLMPRFLLTGDHAYISATIFNALEDSLIISGRIEVFDVISGRIIACSDMPDTDFEGNSSKVISVEVNVPADVNQLGVRTIAQSEKGSDGEQGIVQVLPSSTPVRDATTFYLSPGEKEFSIRLPNMHSAGNVTLNYCDDPYWYVLTSLSGKLYPESESALEQAVALYSVAVSAGILDQNPRLREGLKHVSGDNGEKSPIALSQLNKSQSLKISALNETPWVNNAESETMRVNGLEFLLDSSSVKKAISDAVAGLEKTHNPDGSWSWMKGMPASEWITRQVLSALGQIRVAGYMPSDAENRRSLEKMIDAAIRYTDSEQSKAYRDIITRSKGQYPLESELSYLYLRSNAGVSAPQGLIADMKRDMFKRLPGEWRGLDIDDKAIAAIMLWREGQKELAQTILESVRQYASYKSDKGMWFDRQPKQYFASSSLLLTARCLDAFREIDPDSDAVAQLSQFLVLSRQTTDWNLELGQAGVASVVSSVVRSIKEDWTTAADISDADNGVRIMLGNKEISVPANAQLLTGNFCLNLDTADASGEELHIVRNNSSPAWGGVMNQYIAPIKDVKASGVPQLKISKMLLPLTTEKDGIKASRPSTVFHKGDRVKVTLTIESDRDLDYILISDQLGAWMQPASQLTEYGFQDGLLMLTETRTSKKNYYITRMPKGKYILNYEVNVDRDGIYSTGIAEGQSQYYPLITSHSAGAVVEVK